MKKITAILMVLLLAAGLCACGSKNKGTEKEPASASQSTEAPKDAETEPESLKKSGAAIADATVTAESIPVKVMVITGAGGFGMAKLMADAASGMTSMDYEIVTEADPEVIVQSLADGSCDIALLPSDAAARAYQQSDGGVVAAAAVTRGGLYVIANTAARTITSMEDLAGRAVPIAGSAASAAAAAIFATDGWEIDLDTSIGQASDLVRAMAEGKTDLAILAEPAASVAVSSIDGVQNIISLGDLWNSVCGEGTMVMNCAAFRRDFVTAHPEAAAAFLAEYQSSVSYLAQSPNDAARLIEETGIFGRGDAALAAIPNCGCCALTGQEMKEPLSVYLRLLHAADPAFVGGEVPGDDFYYIPG